MRSYQIAGLKLKADGENTFKIDEFLKEFSEREEKGDTVCNLIVEKSVLLITYRDADNKKALEEIRDKLVYMPEYTGFKKINPFKKYEKGRKQTIPLEYNVMDEDNFIEESICYGIRCKTLKVGEELNYLITRQIPLTEGFLLADEDWSRLTVVDDCIESRKITDWDWKRKFVKGGTLDQDNEWIELFLAGFYSYATLHDMMLIHASAIKYQNKAVLFTAPSGTGKTTQAELWRDAVGAKILNGDRVFIKYKVNDKRLYAWGSPWSGSSPYIVNDCAEVAAIVVLEQSNENSLRRLDVREAMMHLSSNSFLPMWDEKCLEGMLGVMDQVLRNVPIYKLACRPDEEAVELVRMEVFR